jgi:hypothetical protein
MTVVSPVPESRITLPETMRACKVLVLAFKTFTTVF